VLLCLDAAYYKNVTFILRKVPRQYNLVIFLLIFYKAKEFKHNAENPEGTNRLTLCFENEYIRFIIKIFSTGYNALQIQRVTIKKG
jgi:hypothetical protein